MDFETHPPGTGEVLRQLRAERDALEVRCAELEHKPLPFGERTPAVMTYKNQPGNVGASRIGQACAKAACCYAGDSIDRGLLLLRELQAQGYGIVHLDAIPAYLKGTQ